MAKVTTGVLKMLNRKEIPSYNPVLIVQAWRLLQSTPSGPKYRVLVNDGTGEKILAVFNPELGNLIENNKIKQGDLIEVIKYNLTDLQKGSETQLLFLVQEVRLFDDRTPLTDIDSNAAQMKTPPKPTVNRPMPNTPNTPGGTAKVYPIETLNPYQGRWTIRVRVSQKGSIRTWNKNGREGKLFSFTVADNTGEIRITAFNSEADRFYDLIEVNKAYEITRGSLKPANRQFNNTNNEYEITLGSDSVITPCEDTVAVPQISFDFVPLAQLEKREPGTFVDVLGMAHDWTEVTTITSKTTQKDLVKREISLVDDSMMQVRLTLWGSEAESFNPTSKPVIVVKAARLGDFGGRNLSVAGGSTLMINPTNLAQAVRLRGWYDYEGSTKNFDSFRADGGGASGGGADGSGGYSRLVNVVDTKQITENIAAGKVEYYTFKADTVFFKRESFLYKACPNEGCQKKLAEQGIDQYRCEKCNTVVSNYKWRVLLIGRVSDSTGDQFMTIFQETAEKILGTRAEELGQLEERGDSSALDKIFCAATFKSWIFRARAKQENYNDETRLKLMAMDVNPVDYIQYGHYLKSAIEKLRAELPRDFVPV